jgi:hypothetical protein
MRRETKVRRRVWMYVLYHPRPRPGPCPRHRRALLISASASRHHATACAPGRRRARWTSRRIPVRVRGRSMSRLCFKLLAGVCAPAFLVKRAYRCRETHAHMHTQIWIGLGADVRARVSVEVGMESAGPGSGTRTSSPRGCRVCVL